MIRSWKAKYTRSTFYRFPHRTLQALLVVLCMTVPCLLSAHPLPALLISVADSTFYDHYPFIHFIDTREDATLIRLTDEDFLDKAGKVIFKVNTYDTFTNDTLLQLLEKEIIPRINKDSLHLRRLIVRGASSPEGSVPNNRMLGRRRSETLSLFLRAHLSVPADEENLSTEVVAEDYSLLLIMMERAGDPAAGMVRSLCEQHLPRYEYTLLKRKLQQLQGGILWRHLLKDYFPELRSARIVLVFDEPDRAYEAHKPNEPHEPHKPNEPHEPNEPNEPHQLPVPRREVLSVKTNLLLYGFYLPGGYDRWCPIPNVAVEFYPLRGHFTYGASIDFPWWRNYNEFKFFQVRNYQVEARYYFKAHRANKPNETHQPYSGPAFRGWYLQGYFGVGLFNICFDKDSGYEGEYLGGGIGAGYVLPLTRKGHWKLEFQLQAGVVYGKYDPYQWENLINPSYHDNLYYYRWTGKASDFKLRQYRFSWIGPTRVGITLTYDLLYLRGKKGVSFRSWEKIIEE